LDHFEKLTRPYRYRPFMSKKKLVPFSTASRTCDTATPVVRQIAKMTFFPQAKSRGGFGRDHGFD
jgi:hypothetical protein